MDRWKRCGTSERRRHGPIQPQEPMTRHRPRGHPAIDSRGHARSPPREWIEPPTPGWTVARGRKPSHQFRSIGGARATLPRAWPRAYHLLDGATVSVDALQLGRHTNPCWLSAFVVSSCWLDSQRFLNLILPARLEPRTIDSSTPQSKSNAGRATSARTERCRRSAPPRCAKSRGGSLMIRRLDTSPVAPDPVGVASDPPATPLLPGRRAPSAARALLGGSEVLAQAHATRLGVPDGEPGNAGRFLSSSFHPRSIDRTRRPTRRSARNPSARREARCRPRPGLDEIVHRDLDHPAAPSSGARRCQPAIGFPHLDGGRALPELALRPARPTRLYPASPPHRVGNQFTSSLASAIARHTTSASSQRDALLVGARGLRMVVLLALDASSDLVIAGYPPSKNRNSRAPGLSDGTSRQGREVVVSSSRRRPAAADANAMSVCRASVADCFQPDRPGSAGRRGPEARRQPG